MAIEVLSSLRHTCISCGGSCQGTYVRLLGDEETARIVDLSAKLGVPDPIVGGRLRHERGRCVFLGADQLCDIHRRFGMQAKPTVCQQYPLVAVRTDAAVRVGIDPGCYAGLRTWRLAPEVPDTKLVATPTPIDPAQLGFEQAFLDRTEDATVARALALLTGEAPDDDDALPQAFASRLVTRLQAADLRALIDLPDTAPALRDALNHVVDAIDGWRPDAPPAWPVLDPEADAWAVDVTRRMVHLRLAASSIPVVAGVALLTLSGAVACAWADPGPDRFGFALAAWTRALRAPAFWTAIVPDGPALGWLASGK